MERKTGPKPVFLTPSARFALFFSGLVLLSQAFTLPSAVINSVTEAWQPGYSFHYPDVYILLAPFSLLADAFTVLGVRASYSLLAWVVVLSFLFWGVRRFWAPLIFFVGFLAWGALVPRPMAKLMAPTPDTLLIDFHSHSRVSHDGRPSFDADANRQWHKDQGYGASFITDHNRIETSKLAKEASRRDWKTHAYRSLEGEEISLARTHLVVLGVSERIDNQPYDSDPKKVPLFIRDMHKKGLLVIASLPEYWIYHWGPGVRHLIDWGIDGFEIINSAPKALDFPHPKKLEILDLCKRHNLFVTGISDSHGYGSATATWNAMTLPGWQEWDPDQLETRVIRSLKQDRNGAVTVLARPRPATETPLEVVFAPWVALLLVWRSLNPPLMASCVAWIWITTFLYSALTATKRKDGPKA